MTIGIRYSLKGDSHGFPQEGVLLDCIEFHTIQTSLSKQLLTESDIQSCSNEVRTTCTISEGVVLLYYYEMDIVK